MALGSSSRDPTRKCPLATCVETLPRQEYYGCAEKGAGQKADAHMANRGELGKYAALDDDAAEEDSRGGFVKSVSGCTGTQASVAKIKRPMQGMHIMFPVRLRQSPATSSSPARFKSSTGQPIIWKYSGATMYRCLAKCHHSEEVVRVCMVVPEQVHGVRLNDCDKFPTRSAGTSCPCRRWTASMIKLASSILRGPSICRTERGRCFV